jgi:glycosyltransferase involved in cell wall biosynthesis
MLPRLAEQGYPIIVVDDASPDSSFDALQRILNDHVPDATLLRHAENLGKGGAVMTGLRAALDAGFTHSLQIDADGQHDTADISAICAAAAGHKNSIICGQPTFDQSISSLRYYARYITLTFSWLESLSIEIRDAFCGFRLYPIESVIDLVENGRLGSRMTFDPEILVRALWADISLQFVPVRVIYPAGGKSHFRYIRDNIEISWMHARLILGMLIRLPTLIRRNRSRRLSSSEL